MIDRVPYGKLASYPHMKPADAVIWERFIEKYPDEYDEVIYDLNVGAGYADLGDHPQEVQGDYRILTQKKIDVVAFKDDYVDIIEIKPDASMSALGQAIGYVKLYLGYRDPKAEAYATVITDRLKPDMAHLAAHLGVWVVVV